MNWEEYKVLASRTMVDRGTIHDLLHMNSGIHTELGELNDIFKRHHAYDKDIDVIHVKEELGDICWYEANRERLFGKYPPSKLRLEYCDYTDIMRDIISHKIEKRSCINMIKKIADFYDLNFEDILQTNINKLQVRFPEKFNYHDALNRDLQTERQILEK